MSLPNPHDRFMSHAPHIRGGDDIDWIAFMQNSEHEYPWVWVAYSKGTAVPLSELHGSTRTGDEAEACARAGAAKVRAALTSQRAREGGAK